MNIYADTMIYGCTSQILDDQSLIAVLSSDLTLNRAGYIQCLENQTSDVPSHPELLPAMMNKWSFREAPYLENFLGLKLNQGLKCNSYI